MKSHVDHSDDSTAHRITQCRADVDHPRRPSARKGQSTIFTTTPASPEVSGSGSGDTGAGLGVAVGVPGDRGFVSSVSEGSGFVLTSDGAAVVDVGTGALGSLVTGGVVEHSADVEPRLTRSMGAPGSDGPAGAAVDEDVGEGVTPGCVGTESTFTTELTPR